MKTSELTDPALDWAVAKAEDIEVEYGDWNTLWRVDKNVFGERRCVQGDNGTRYQPSTDWAQGGPIIEREGITVSKTAHGFWEAYKRPSSDQESYEVDNTPLIAAMRCFVASKLGDEVDVPKELQ